ncbi:lytic transglycosylase [Thiomicrorhabdus xiamenensis]|uniref:LysM peptidoglycan-binding domain-containing protein n=1 Tax=Thiomicrorhabdus xiamenensis TaxID=2739063 RepID=A0A7D4NP72_9GAMM|nr:LysM peptidoglycan-binding domain-containing protein [Thiomicrorhabdus xiamenensis]QKI89373.1 LysM peptidoglycan-binding domain-containing protein [Thiomicrorhabdus xiamenensis]
MNNHFDATAQKKTEKSTFSALLPPFPNTLTKSLSLLGLGLATLQLSGCNLPLLSKSSGDHYEQKLIKPQTPEITAATVPAKQTSQREVLHLGDKPEIKKEIEAQYLAQEKAKPTSNNLWDHFKGEFKLVEFNQGHFDHSISYYKKRQKHIVSVSARAKPYLYYIVEEVKNRNMPLEIALLPMVESGFQPHAKSHRKALGLWQFMPGTAEMLGLERNWWYDGRRDVVQSTQAALTYLQRHYNNTHDWLLSLASYNAGYGNVLKAIKRYQKKHGQSEQLPSFWQIKKYLPKETQNYVPALLSLAYLIEHNDRYQLALEPIANKPFFDVVELDKQVSLYAVASNTQTSRELLAMLNPGYIRKATPPQGPHHLLLPVGKDDVFNERYQKNAAVFRVNWQKHKVRSGDYLGKIASRYGTSVSAIRKLNNMRGSFIRVGQTLLIPVVSTSTQLASSSPTAPKPPAKQQSRKPDNVKNRVPQNLLVYHVQSGDTLSEIAERFSVSTDELLKWNKLSKKSLLKVGQKLFLAENKIQGQQLTYKVKSGETLSEIASVHGVSVNQLMQWNRIQSAKTIQPGEQLTIWQGPKTSKHTKYTVKNGDNLWDIAKEFKLSVKSLAQYNRLTLKSMLQPGQILKIPFNI